MSELEIAGLVAGYRGTEVLRGVDLHVPAGELTAVLGPSGCGKTTLLRAIAGFLRPAAGEIQVGGRVVASASSSLPPERRRVTIVPQEAALFPHLSVAGNIGYGLPGWSGRARKVRRERVGELLELVGLAGHGARRPHELSGGQQQRVALARALAPRPAAVLLDEPFSALDAGLRDQVRTQVLDILTGFGATAVLVTHDQDEALSMAGQVAVLRDGRVAQAGPPEEIYGKPVDIALARFLGDAVLLPATAAGADAESALGRVGLAAPARGAGAILLRPEQLRLVPAVNGHPVAVVRTVRFHGHDAVVSLRTSSGADLLARVPAPLVVRPGDEVGVEVLGRGVFFAGEAGR
ncbi:ABC transporter ATP-binding protein [Nocardia puris]|uniref:ABC-type quaternary amine transporter n=1 Tax=Nocardia puris TaxID=208602 RepID=A0A366DDY9_9NOCA|nr:ABC transporter ATP-binding protein [Nocardia puris]RBO88261.1 iron(III) transport system ATP-binding protein [Nocardia puris]